MPVNNLPPIRIYLLGRFEVRHDGQVLQTSGWSRRKAAALLQRLALDKRLLRDEALEFLWPESDPTAAANNLYRTLYSTRQTLDEALGAGTAKATFSYDDGILRLADGVWVDAHSFETICRKQTATPAQLQEALALYEGQLLPDNIYDGWTASPRQTLHRLYRDACLQLANEVTDLGDIETAAAHLRPFLEEDPADEVIHRQLMVLLALLGRRHEALRQYQACKQALDEELGILPTSETRSLHQEILRNEVQPPPPQTILRQPILPVPVTTGRGQQPPLAGRQTELNTLHRLLDATATGQGKTVLIEGETGVGKTRLAQEFLQVATSLGMIVLSGAAYEYEDNLAYQPFTEAISRYLAQAEHPSLQHPLTHFTPLEAGDPQQEKWALFSNIGAFFAELTTEAPVVLFLDDLHTADEASLQLFHYLARHTRSRPLLLAAAYRTDIVLDPVSPFGSLLNALYREDLRETVSLQPLVAEAIADIVRHIHGSDVDPGLLNLIAKATEGNPFFAEEMCSSLLRSDHVVQENGIWRLKAGNLPEVPSDLRQLLRRRIAQSGEAVTSALEVAAVMGRSFHLPILHRVSILSEPDLVEALDAALKANFIEGIDNGYRFRHGITQRALYQAHSRPRKRRLHRLIAAAVENAFESGGNKDSLPVETMAYHYERSDQPQRALPYLEQAGKRAAALYAYEGAISYYERALTLMDEHEMDDNHLRWRLLESLGWWQKILANTPASVARFEQALSLTANEQWQPKPNERARLHAGAAMALLTAGDTTAAEDHLKAAQEQIDPDEYASEYADILYNVAQLRWHRNEYEEAFAAAQQSLEIAEQLDDATAVARAFEMLALACHSLGEWQMGLDFEEKRSAIAGPELDVSDAFDVHL